MLSLLNDPGGPSANFWLVNGSGVCDDVLTHFAAQLGPSESRRFVNFIRPARQRQFLLGRMLLRYAAADLTGLFPDGVRVVESPGNPPRLIFPYSERSAPHFSISHSGKWVACVISAEAVVGLDIEVNDPKRDIEAIAEIAFEPDEHSRLMAQSPAERVAAFYSLWCASEASFKLLCNLNLSSDASLSVEDENERSKLHQYQRRFADLTVAISSDRQLSAIHQKRLTDLNGAD